MMKNTVFPLLIFALSLLIFILAGCTNGLRSSPGSTPDQAVLGSQVFANICAACHGENAQGYANALQAPALDASEHAPEHPDQQVHDWIVNGKLGFGRQMPAFGDQLTDDEVHAVIEYLHTLWTPEQLEIQQDITSRWPATPEPGPQP